MSDSTSKLKELYQQARQHQAVIEAHEKRGRELSDKQEEIETAMMNEMAAIAGDDSQPFSNSALVLLGRVLALADQKVLYNLNASTKVGE
ncbi:hypothetical protein C6W88_15735 [Halomonas litopenaei]|uniref:Uncharacterized protein n=1 Tax=Halomonas litopenaei TaxID=2109328 RepID=A0ABX5IWH2_9GAMM|nr:MULTISPECIES: hypothetical protein [Halomonas]PTL88835.1 hypothetical protein C6W89_19970 [Halomonas sp. SYSU XM8]PTL93462.1 hypothetical protein C6W88_15735 [Halomonas litopenaei]